MSANAERVIKPRTFISTKPGLRRRVCVARSSLRLPRAAVKRPCFRRGFVSGAQRRLQITSNGNHAQRGRFIIATIRGSKLLQGRDGVIVGSHSGSSGAPRAVHGVFRVRNLVGGPRFDPGASRSRTVVMSCPPVSPRLLKCPLVLDCCLLRVLPGPPRSSWFRDSVPRLCPGDGPRTGQKPTPFRGNELRLAGADPSGDTDNTDGSRYSVEMSDCAQRWRRWCSRSQSVAVNHTLSSRKDDTARPYRPHSSTRSWRPEPYPAPFKPPAARRPWQARSTHPRTTGHRRGSRISPL